MGLLATAEELRVHMGLAASSFDDTRAEDLLTRASRLAQTVAHQTFELVADDEVELDGRWKRTMYLPERPVTAVTAVAIDDTPLTVDVDYTWSRNGKLSRITQTSSRRVPRPRTGWWGGDEAVVTVTYSHGYASIPEDVKGIVLAAAARTYTNPTGKVSESIGTWSASHGGAGAFERGGIAFTSFEQAALREYGRVRDE